ncbi:MAG: hypothetical protein H6618_08155 [Deltaproteobacteria bacterium]|nr:hypothetical protein [Deltaproteobacteria bacterium]
MNVLVLHRSETLSAAIDQAVSDCGYLMGSVSFRQSSTAEFSSALESLLKEQKRQQREPEALIIDATGTDDDRLTSPLRGEDPELPLMLNEAADSLLIRPVMASYLIAQNMVQKGRGRVIQILPLSMHEMSHSDAFFESSPGASLWPFQAAMMSALQTWTRGLALFAKDSGLTANNIICGPAASQSPHLGNILEKTPGRKSLSPQGLSGVITFLLDPQNHYLTGQNIMADQGASIW